ncbi:MAG: DNA alkylation repair protein [Planctomycetes bacterium]|nr:DNA alkylation repair protein [Planctomycetota bacterium]
MTVDEIVKELKALGKEAYKNVLKNHGVQEPFFGVKIEELKKIQKRVRKNYQLALDLYDTGIYDAMYLAGLVADDFKMTKKNLKHWAEKASCNMLSEYTVPWVAAESGHGRELALEWIESKNAKIAATGWATLSGIVAMTDDAKLNMAELKQLMDRVRETIRRQPDRVQYVMNGFLIAVGSYVGSLSDAALQTAEKLGPIVVGMGNTECKVPYAPDYIQKARKRGSLGKKRKTVKC